MDGGCWAGASVRASNPMTAGITAAARTAAMDFVRSFINQSKVAAKKRKQHKGPSSFVFFCVFWRLAQRSIDRLHEPSASPEKRLFFRAPDGFDHDLVLGNILERRPPAALDRGL